MSAAEQPWMPEARMAGGNITKTNYLTNSSDENSSDQNSPHETSDIPSEQPISSQSKIPVNFLGHSLGSLLIVNILRILSDKYGKDERIEREKSDIGDYLILDKLI